MTVDGARARSFDAWATDYDRFQVRHVVEQPPEAVVGLAFTASYVRALPAEDQERLADELEALVERHAAGAASVRLPYVVDCEVARRRSP